METTLIMMFVVVMIFLAFELYVHNSQMHSLLDRMAERGDKEREASQKSMALIAELKMLGANPQNFHTKTQSDLFKIELENNKEEMPVEDEDVTMPTEIEYPETFKEFTDQHGFHKGETWWDDAYTHYLNESKDKEGNNG